VFLSCRVPPVHLHFEGDTSTNRARILRRVLPDTQHTRTRFLPMRRGTPDAQAHSFRMPNIRRTPEHNSRGSPRPPASNDFWYKGGNRCPSRVCQEEQGVPEAKDLGKPIGNTTYKPVRNTTHSEHKQQENTRPIHNQAAHPGDHTCKPCCKYVPSRHIPCARIRRLLARWRLGPVM